MTFFTIGHSNRSASEFLAMLRESGVDLVADVRSVPGSRHNPQFNRPELAAAVESEGMEYIHMAGLGGFRKASPTSVNTGWRKMSFRGYADYMQTPGFARALDELLAASEGRTVAIMCAEAVPWRCHRSLIADALITRGHEVVDLLGPGQAREHEMTPFALVEGETVTYPG